MITKSKTDSIFSGLMISLSLSLILVFFIMLSCNSSKKPPIKTNFVPGIQYDNAILRGKITGMAPDAQGFNTIKVGLNRVVTGDVMRYEIPVKKDGTFTYSIPVQCITFAPVSSDYFEGIICLIPGEETKLEISFDSEQKKHVKLINSLGFTENDAITYQETVMAQLSNLGIGYEIVAPEIFSQRIIDKLPAKLKEIENSNKLSSSAKQFAINEIKIYFIYFLLDDYGTIMANNYINQHKNDKISNEFHPQVPGKSYYSFYKYFNLNDPSYLCVTAYPYILQSLLKNKTLAIPSIGEMSIDNWLIKVKEILKNYIGSDAGLIYDLLVANAFSLQLNDMNPLSDIQKKNIRSYFTNKSFVDILIDENEKVIQLAANRTKASVFTIDKSSNNLMDSIISKYRGKVVFVDFWATWCGPCLNALKESESVKKEFENKDVVFAYITDPSSPRKAWEQKISEIGGEHYYLTEKDWNYLNKKYGFTGIPHYLIFNKSGVLKYNYTTFMGTENMRKWIIESL